MPRLALVSVVVVVTSCMTDFPDLAARDGGASGGEPSTGGVAGGAFGGASGNGGGSGGSGGSVGGTAGDASTGGQSGAGGTIADSGPDAPLVPGLLGHWPFDDATGSIASDVVAGNDGVLPATGATWTQGLFGGAIALAVPTTGVDVDAWYDDAFPDTGTVTLWLKSEIVANDTSSRGVFDNFDTALDHLFVRRANGSPTIALQCAFQAAGQYAFVKTVPIQSDVWQLVAVGWSSTQGFCYVNGTMQTGTVDLPWSPAQQRFRVGANLTGTIDDVRLYDHMLGVGELAKLLAEGP
jgi:hypothetical protein